MGEVNIWARRKEFGRQHGGNVWGGGGGEEVPPPREKRRKPGLKLDFSIGEN